MAKPRGRYYVRHKVNFDGIKVPYLELDLMLGKVKIR